MTDLDRLDGHRGIDDSRNQPVASCSRAQWSVVRRLGTTEDDTVYTNSLNETQMIELRSKVQTYTGLGQPPLTRDEPHPNPD